MLTAYLCLVLAVGVARLVELNVSRRHRRSLFDRGASIVPDPGFVAMVSLHVAILACCVLEVLLLQRVAPVWLFVTMFALVLAANALRIWAIVALGDHWNVRIVDSTRLGVVSAGPYRYLRHPNYLAVFVELLCLPLVHGAWLTAVSGAVLHAVVLRRRISNEETMLLRDPRYQAQMAGKPRWIPRLRVHETTSPSTAGGSAIEGQRD